jgi:transposase-like protein
MRWGNEPYCAHCGSENVTKRKKAIIFRCNSCKKDFTVLVGTIFEHSRLSLAKWFVLISLMLDAKKGIAAMQISRHLGTNYQTAWYSGMRVRCAMAEDITLEGTVEADETFLGGKPRKKYKQSESATALSQFSDDVKKNKRGHGTDQAKVAGMVERKGKVVLKMMESFTTRNMLAMLRRYVNMKDAVVITDGAQYYKQFDEHVRHLTIKHKKHFAEGEKHINTMEGFWSIVKSGVKGQYRSLSKKYLPYYLAEFSYKYNRRNDRKLYFEDYIKTALSKEKCLLHAHPVKPAKQIFYPPKKSKRL